MSVKSEIRCSQLHNIREYTNIFVCNWILSSLSCGKFKAVRQVPDYDPCWQWRPLNILLEKEIMKIMQGIHSYRKPREIVDFFNITYVSHQYNFRETLAFQIPLIKSIRLSSSPIFTFPFVFNHFPEHFKEIMERKDFREKLDMYYIDRFKNPNCIKRNCKFCHYFDYKMKQLNFAISYSSKSYSFFKYT